MIRQEQRKAEEAKKKAKMGLGEIAKTKVEAYGGSKEDRQSVSETTALMQSGSSAAARSMEFVADLNPLVNMANAGYGHDSAGNELSAGGRLAEGATAGIGVLGKGVQAGARIAKVAGNLKPAGAVVNGLKKGGKATLTALDKTVLKESLQAFRSTKVGDVVALEASTIRFTQNTISKNFSDKVRPVADLVKDLKSGKVSIDDIPPIRVFERDGKMYSLDNRRLFAAQEAGVKIRIEKMDLKEAEDFMKKVGRFSTENDGTSIVVRNGK